MAEVPLREPVYEYHWGRILGVIAGLVLLLGAGGYGLYTWLTPDSPRQRNAESLKPAPAAPGPAVNEQPQPRAESETLEQAQPSPPVATPAQTATATAPAEATSSPASVEEAPPTPADQVPPETGEEPAAARLGETVVEGPDANGSRSLPPQAASSEPEPALAETPQEPPQAKPRSATASVPQAAPEAAPSTAPETVQSAPAAEQPDGGPFQLRDLRILVPQVKRFELPRTVIDKEPQGTMEEIRLKPDGSAAVWCYSEVVDSRGGELRYVWYHEGERMARIRVKVRGNRWRSYSSKIINQRHQGNWRVELQDGAERLLASAEFTLK